MAQYTSTNLIFGRTFANAMLAALKTVPGAALLAAGKVRLSSDAAFSPTADTTLAALVANESAFTGYPAGGVAVSLTTGVDVQPQTQGAITSAVFEGTGTRPLVAPGVAYGYWIDDGVEPAVMEKFPSPVTFENAGDYLVLNCIIPELLNQSTTL